MALKARAKSLKATLTGEEDPERHLFDDLVPIPKTPAGMTGEFAKIREEFVRRKGDAEDIKRGLADDATTKALFQSLEECLGEIEELVAELE